MTKAHVAAFLTNGHVPELSESESILRPKSRAAWGSSRDDNASNQDVIRVRDFLAAAFHVFEAKIDGFADVCQSFRDSFALGIAAGKRGAHHNVAAVVFVRLEKDFEIACGHLLHPSEAATMPQAASNLSLSLLLLFPLLCVLRALFLCALRVKSFLSLHPYFLTSLLPTSATRHFFRRLTLLPI